MIVRIVQLTIRPDKLDAFIDIFESSKGAIKSSPGCLELQLLANTRFPNIVTTLSKWESEEALATYRESALFKATWSKTKLLFAAAPVAFSHRPISAAE